MPFSLTYVSKSRLAKDSAEQAVDQLVEHARRYNQSVGITGALIFTGTDFAQTLEGEEQEVRTLMSRICEDDRHERIEIIYTADHPEREYRDWTMAYRGVTTFVQRHVDATRADAGPPPHESAPIELRQLMRGFAESAPR